MEPWLLTETMKEGFKEEEGIPAKYTEKQSALKAFVSACCHLLSGLEDRLNNQYSSGLSFFTNSSSSDGETFSFQDIKNHKFSLLQLALSTKHSTSQ